MCDVTVVSSSSIDSDRGRTRPIPVMYNISNQMNMVTAVGTVICQTGAPSRLVPTNIPSVVVKRINKKADSSMADSSS
jgi:hypothetical protein